MVELLDDDCTHECELIIRNEICVHRIFLMFNIENAFQDHTSTSPSWVVAVVFDEKGHQSFYFSAPHENCSKVM